MSDQGLITRTTETLPRKEDPPRTFPKGRTCSNEDCANGLSVYNRGPQCYACRFVHTGETVDLEELMAA